MKLDTCLLGSLSQDIVIKGCLVAKLYLDALRSHGLPGFPVLHYLPEFTQTHVHQVCDAIQPSHPLSPPSPPALSLSQHQGLFQRVSFASGSQSIWRRKWQSTPVFLPGESQGWGSLVGCRLWGRTESDTTEVT